MGEEELPEQEASPAEESAESEDEEEEEEEQEQGAPAATKAENLDDVQSRCDMFSSFVMFSTHLG